MLLTDGVAQPTATANDVPWWAEYDVTNLWHDFAADDGTALGRQLRQRLHRGRPGATTSIFGELGNDTIQGDGSIDLSRRGSPTTTLGGIAAVQRVGAFRTPPAARGAAGLDLRPDRRPRSIYPSVERATDGEDYIEGNGGNDVIFGGLGQDDIVGGSSDFFSLTTPYLRPDGGDDPTRCRSRRHRRHRPRPDLRRRGHRRSTRREPTARHAR